MIDEAQGDAISVSVCVRVGTNYLILLVASGVVDEPACLAFVPEADDSNRIRIVAGLTYPEKFSCVPISSGDNRPICDYRIACLVDQSDFLSGDYKPVLVLKDKTLMSFKMVEQPLVPQTVKSLLKSLVLWKEPIGRWQAYQSGKSGVFAQFMSDLNALLTDLRSSGRSGEGVRMAPKATKDVLPQKRQVVRANINGLSTFDWKMPALQMPSHLALRSAVDRSLSASSLRFDRVEDIKLVLDLMRQKNWQAALEVLEMLSSECHGHAIVMQKLAECELMLGAAKKASKRFYGIAKMFPGFVWAYCGLVDSLIMDNRLDEASLVLRRMPDNDALKEGIRQFKTNRSAQIKVLGATAENISSLSKAGRTSLLRMAKALALRYARDPRFSLALDNVRSKLGLEGVYESESVETAGVRHARTVLNLAIDLNGVC